MWPFNCLTLLSTVLLIDAANSNPIMQARKSNSAAGLERNPDWIPFVGPPFSLDFMVKKETLVYDELSLDCIDLQVFGAVEFFTTHVIKSESLIEKILSDPLHFLLDPAEPLVNALGLNIEIQFTKNTGAYFEFGIEASAGFKEHAFTLFKSETPISVFIDGVTIAVVAFLDLVIESSAEIDIQSGFHVLLPEGAFIIINPLNGFIEQFNFDGAVIESLPVTVISGSASITAALRVRVETGISVDIPLLPGNGFDFSLGVFADIVKYEATISSSPACPLEFSANALIDIGAAASFGVEIDSKSFEVFPTVLEVIYSNHFALTCLHHPVPTTTSSILTITSSLISSTTPTSLTLPHGTGTTAIASSHNPTSITIYPSGSPTSYSVHTSAPYANKTDTETTPCLAFTSFPHTVVTPVIPSHPATLTPCATRVITTINALVYYAPTVLFSHPAHSYADYASKTTQEYNYALPTTNSVLAASKTVSLVPSGSSYIASYGPASTGTGASPNPLPTFTSEAVMMPGNFGFVKSLMVLILGYIATEVWS